MADLKNGKTSQKRLSTKDKKVKIGLQMIELMEKSGLPVWRCPWIFGSPDMAYKGAKYNGVNAVILALARSAFGYKSRLWLTHTKVEALNGKTWTPSKTGKPLDKVRKYRRLLLRTYKEGVPRNSRGLLGLV